jgi:hypothetical protein
MSTPRKKMRPISIGTELLESRQLLNAHLPHHPAAHVASVATHAIHQISGTLTGTSTYVENTDSTSLLAFGTDTYSLSGKTNHGAVVFTSQDSVISDTTSPTTFRDTYYGGNATLTLSDGSTVAIAYVASGHSSTDNAYTATYQGKAIGTSGAEKGHVYSFTASIKAVAQPSLVDQNVTFKFALKD